MSPGFADLRFITNSIECVEKGINPYTNACAPWTGPFNYPSLWLRLGAIGITSASANWIGIVFIVLFCVSLLLIFNTQTFVTGIVAFIAAISPPVLLGLERGNIDMLIFSVLVSSLFLLAKATGFGALIISSGLIAFLSILKIYPVVSASIFIRQRLGWWGIGLTGVLVVVGLLSLGGLDELKAIAQNTPQQLSLAYGALPIFLFASNHGLLQNVDASALRTIAACFALFVAGSAIIVSLLRPNILRDFVPNLDKSSEAIVAMACMSIFCFTFVLGSNFDYRLTFLIGVLPFLLKVYDEQRQAYGLVAPAAIILFVYLSRISRLILVPFELMDWFLFFVGIIWLGEVFFRRNNFVSSKWGVFLRHR
jgi:hypothetical protein